MKQLEIKTLNKQEESMPMDLLLLADPSEEALNDYLPRGEVYTAHINGQTVGVCVLIHTRPFTAEIVNIAVQEEYQGQGIGTKLIHHAIAQARKARFKTLEIGTGNPGSAQVMLYQKCGFTITSVDHDFFRIHYPEPIFENGLECRHMIRMRMELNQR